MTSNNNHNRTKTVKQNNETHDINSSCPCPCPFCKYENINVYFDKETKLHRWDCPHCQSFGQLRTLKRTAINQDKKQQLKINLTGKNAINYEQLSLI